jgi:diadenosine tetraphosphatase ApaH/serine/threonine PP2A family protein phosphatase
MRIALMSDIHANREAFAACLAHAERAGVDRYIFLGDYVGYGADPEWAVDTLMAHVERGAVALKGNHDDAISNPRIHMNEVAETAIEWTRRRLDDRQRAFLAALPLTRQDSDQLFVHASAFVPQGWHYVVSSHDARMSFEATGHRLTFCGHVHVPQLYHLGPSRKVGAFTPVPETAVPLLPQRRWLAVLGAIGQPRDGIPAACYAILDAASSRLTYIRVAYEVQQAAQKIRAAGLPAFLALRLEQGY